GRIANEFDVRRQQYLDITSLGDKSVDGLGRFGFDNIRVHIPLSQGVPDLDRIQAQTFAGWRSAIVGGMMDSLYEDIDDIHGWFAGDCPARTLAYALLGLTDRDLQHYGLTLTLQPEHQYTPEHGYRDLDHGFKGRAVRHFGSSIGWDVDSMRRLTEAEADPGR